MNNIPEYFLDRIQQAKEKRLTLLDLSNKWDTKEEYKLTEIPEEVFELEWLEVLYLNYNNLSCISEYIYCLINLKELYLYCNNLTILSNHITDLVNLTKLDLSHNQLTSLPDSLTHLVNLTKLDLSFNQLTSLPDSLTRLVNLTYLDLRGNQLTSLPDSLTRLVNLTYLDLRGNQLTSLPDSLTRLVNLIYLYLGRNQLSSLLNSLTRLVNLTELDLSFNQLTSLPDSLTPLVNLTELDLSDNQLSSFPDSLTSLVNLTELYLTGNQLSSLPDSLTRLAKLSRLNLSRNQLSNLPDSLTRLVNLTYLYLKGNPLETPPLEIAQQGIEAIREYFRQKQQEGEDTLYEAKLIILGEAGAGKTSLAKKIENPNYKVPADEDSTQGIDVKEWHFTLDNNQDFRVNIWDFGGQEIYHETHQFFLTKRSLYVLVADNRREDTDFYYWLNVVELLSDNSPLLIIQNEKQDRQRDINERQLRGQFTNLKEAFASNLATNRGLDPFIKTIKHYISTLPHVGSTLPKTWTRVREALEKDPRNYISLEEYLTLCKNNGFKQQKDSLQLSQYLHDIGVILHFQDDRISPLYKTVILKPEWGTAAVYKVLDNQTVRNKLGRFTQENLTDIWQGEEYTNMQGELLQLMMRFKLCYQLPNSDNIYIAPQLLTANQPEYNWDETNNLILRYTYEFMPKGMIRRFIVEMHRFIEQQKYVWKEGVILNQDDTKAEVIENYGKREIKIRVVGKDKRDLMTIVTHELDKIHNSYHRLKYKKLIPCNCKSCKDSQYPWFYDYEKLKKFIQDREPNIQCQESYQMVEVTGLIDDVINDFNPLIKTKEDIKLDSLEKEVFISYNWGGESEEIVNQLDQAFQNKGITLKRDKRDLGYKGLIKEFMQRIGRGKCVVVVISDKYLTSHNCMFELIEVAKHKNFYKRIFPIVLDDAKIYKSVDRIKYIQYWKQEIEELDQAMKTVSSDNLQGFREDIDLYTEIRKYIAQLVYDIKDMNTLNLSIHQKSGFEEIFQAVESKLNE
ncbi:Miro domain protein [Gloeothece citriformis PCC 7424]|uniref:non-specific serine/threonine protein kinase n=1 Tax=Gloeothece citriformis (strain PCC 7424) TaxID=65393 RepID=B7KEE8_GLOC7|nr:COR domain-containing protein [Gloeothece citriformis]ACK73266.1 Miro domain protein [Gloeothece citriformis PCC 7424]